MRQNLKVLTISIMLLGRIHFNMVLLTAHNYAQRSAVCAVGAESRWRVFLHSWCDARLSGYYIILALAKTVTPGGSPRREPGQPAPPLKVFHFDQKILAVQKPIAYTDLLASVYLFLNFSIAFMKSFVMDSQLIEVLINSFFEFTS